MQARPPLEECPDRKERGEKSPPEWESREQERREKSADLDGTPNMARVSLVATRPMQEGKPDGQTQKLRSNQDTSKAAPDPDRAQER